MKEIVGIIVKYAILPVVGALLFLAFDLWKNYAKDAQNIYNDHLDKYFTLSINIWLAILLGYYIVIGIVDHFKREIAKKEEILNSEIHKLVLLNHRFDRYQKEELIREQFTTWPLA